MFLLLMFGILEYGLLFRDNLTTNNASQEGARAASVGGRSAQADFLTLQTIGHGIAAMSLDQLNYVVVFNANDPSHPTSAGLGFEMSDGDPCHADSQAGLCNRYVAADFALQYEDGDGDRLGNFGCVDVPPVTAIDDAWCPTVRNAGLGDDSDLIGVFVSTQHDYLTGFFGESQTLTATTVIRVEPDEDT